MVELLTNELFVSILEFLKCLLFGHLHQEFPLNAPAFPIVILSTPILIWQMTRVFGIQKNL